MRIQNVQEAQAVHGISIACFAGTLEPLYGHANVFLNALSCYEKTAQIIHSLCMSLFCSLKCPMGHQLDVLKVIAVSANMVRRKERENVTPRDQSAGMRR